MSTLKLKQQALSGVRWTTLSSVARGVLHLLQLTLLARLVTPQEFGLMAVLVAVVAFLQLFADLGVSNAIVHYQQTTQSQLSSLYWLNIGTSLLLAVLLAAVSRFLAELYGEPRLEIPIALSGLYIVFIAIGQQLRILAEKQLRFSELAKIEVLAATVSAIVAIWIALLDGGVYALLGGLLVNGLLTSFLQWVVLADGWRPQRHVRIAEIHHFLRFGVYAIGNNIVSTINSQIDILLGGWLVGANALGAYALPRDLCLRVTLLVNPIVTRVGFPLMARTQHDQDLLKHIYLKTLRITASVNFPIYVTLAIFAPEFVQVLFGPQWDDAVPLLRVFACWGLLRSTGNPVGSLLYAAGRADLSFKWNASMLLILPLAVWVGGHYGLIGLALSLLFASVALLVPNWYFLLKPICGATFLEYHKQIAVPLAVALVSGLTAYASTIALPSTANRLAAGVAMHLLTYFTLSAMFNRPLLAAMRHLATSHKS